MRTKILVVLFALALSANPRAQVTIGELVEPAKGALLDLNKTVKGGLLLSTVDLPDFHTIPGTFPGMTPTPADLDAVKTGFRGSLVYNTGLTTPPAGIYVWNGVNWTPVKENCTPALLTLMGPPFAKVDANLTFSVSTGASDFCSQGETYKWYLSGVNNSTYTPLLNETAPSLTTSFATVGTYKVMVEVTNRYTVAPLVKEMSVEITADGAPPVTLIDGQYAVNGELCYDVKGPKPTGQTQEFYDLRKNNFTDGFTNTYTFTYTDSFSDLTVLNPGGIVASVSQPAVTYGSGTGSVSFEITFASDVKDRVIANSGLIQVQLIVSFTNTTTGYTKIAYKNIKVQDATCNCPAKKSATEWLFFQCHNLGADYDITSDADLLGITNTNFREYHGDWYRFGSKNVSVENTATTPVGSLTNWTSSPHDDYPFQNDALDWATENDPCPFGWRLPTSAEWVAVLNYNTYSHYVNGVATTSGWITDNTNNNAGTPTTGYNDVLKIGDYLYLPAVGSRFWSTGALHERGLRGTYWSGNHYPGRSEGNPLLFTNATPNMTTMANRSFGYSVRCVSAK
ncbi:MAG: fibrobacter succinogenes major paralogous domain-containing protein [Dysgonamonadaceae bacterium]|jgi:uncharacterized protein (TIGR02145 family)|nr:fibrobacter succinogenes major paralogous domain-containing protein [Dysgonamonadaceae bacterium]